MTSPKGFPIEGKRDENDVPTSKLESKFSTVVPKGVNRRALDVIEGGFFEVEELSQLIFDTETVIFQSEISGNKEITDTLQTHYSILLALKNRLYGPASSTEKLTHPQLKLLYRSKLEDNQIRAIELLKNFMQSQD